MWEVWWSEILVCVWLHGGGQCNPLGNLSIVFPLSMIPCPLIHACPVIRYLTQIFNSKDAQGFG